MLATRFRGHLRYRHLRFRHLRFRHLRFRHLPPQRPVRVYEAPSIRDGGSGCF